jgi:hypothetical protein
MFFFNNHIFSIEIFSKYFTVLSPHGAKLLVNKRPEPGKPVPMPSFHPLSKEPFNRCFNFLFSAPGDSYNGKIDQSGCRNNP